MVSQVTDRCTQTDVFLQIDLDGNVRQFHDGSRTLNSNLSLTLAMGKASHSLAFEEASQGID